MAAASSQRLLSTPAGAPSFLGARQSKHGPCIEQRMAHSGAGRCFDALKGSSSGKGLGSWKATRRRGEVRCSAGGFKGFSGNPKLPMLGTFLGDLRESNKDVKWALDYWDQELEDGYKSLDEWKAQLLNLRQGNPTVKWTLDYWDRELEDGYKSLDEWGAQLSNLRQGNPTIKWAFDYWDKELEDGYKSLDDWRAQLADIQAGTWLNKLRADNPDVKWALDYWDQELIDGYKSLDEWKAQAGDIGNFFSENPIYVAAAVAAISLPLLVFLSMRKGYAGDLSASDAFARLNREDNALLLDIRSKEEKAKEGSPKLGQKVLPVDGETPSEEELRAPVKGRTSDQGALIVVLDRAGNSAPQAAKALAGAGYKRVFVISGGAQGPQGWRESQLPWRPPQTFTLDLGEIKNAVTSRIQELQENKQIVPATLGVAAAAGVSLILFSEAEAALQLLGSAAAVQVFVKKLLFAKDREETIRMVQSFLDTKVPPQELVKEWKGLSTTLVPKSEAAAEAEAAAASPVKILSSSEEGTALEADAEAQKGEAEEKKASSAPKAELPSEATEEVIPEANVEDFVKQELVVLEPVVPVVQIAGEATEESVVDSGVQETTAEIPEVLKEAEGKIPDANVEVSAEGAFKSSPEEGTKEAEPGSVAESTDEVIPDTNVEDVSEEREREVPEERVTGEVKGEVKTEEVAQKIEEVIAVAEEEEEKIEKAEEELGEEGVKAEVKPDYPGSESVSETIKTAISERSGEFEGAPEEITREAQSAADMVKSRAEQLDAIQANEGPVGEEKTSSNISQVEPEEVSKPVHEDVSEPVSDATEAITAGLSDPAGLIKETVGKGVKEAVSGVGEAVSGRAEAVQELVSTTVSGADKEEKLAEEKSADNYGNSPQDGIIEAAESEKAEQKEDKEIEDESIGESVAEQNEAEDATSEGDKTKEATRAIKEALAPDTHETTPEPGMITLLYDSGWERAFLHFSADGGSWTELPGVQFGVDQEGGSKVIRVPASSMQFVTTNGVGDWDTPPYGGNYLINSSGTYRLSSGSVSLVSKVEKQ